MHYKRVPFSSGQGDGAERFARTLRAITVDGRDRLYAVGDLEVKVFAADGRLLRRWPASEPGRSVAVAADGSVYVGQAGQMEIFDPEGGLIATWSDAERLGLVTAIGFLAGRVLVADANDRSIRLFEANGKFVHNIGKSNRMQGFRIPNGVLDFSVDSDGVIHAANPGKHRVERYTADDELLGHFGRFDGLDPAGFPGCCNPTNLTVGDGGRIFVTEKADPRAKVYDAQGELLAVIAADVFDPNCKNMDIAVSSSGRVFVADTVKLEILAFDGGSRS